MIPNDQSTMIPLTNFIDRTATLDSYAAAFHDNPCRATALVYEDEAIRAYTMSIIAMDELVAILTLLCLYI